MMKNSPLEARTKLPHFIMNKQNLEKNKIKLKLSQKILNSLGHTNLDILWLNKGCTKSLQVVYDGQTGKRVGAKDQEEKDVLQVQLDHITNWVNKVNGKFPQIAKAPLV